MKPYYLLALAAFSLPPMVSAEDWRHSAEMDTVGNQLPAMQIRATANYATSLGGRN